MEKRFSEKASGCSHHQKATTPNLEQMSSASTAPRTSGFKRKSIIIHKKTKRLVQAASAGCSSTFFARKQVLLELDDTTASNTSSDNEMLDHWDDLEKDSSQSDGLVEESSQTCAIQGEGVSNFLNLAEDDMRRIFYSLSLPHLLSLRSVCRAFKNIIDDKEFLKWKKLYFRYKHGEADVAGHVEHCVLERFLRIADAESLLVALVAFSGRLMPESLANNAENCERIAIEKVLQRHHLSQIATAKASEACALKTKLLAALPTDHPIRANADANCPSCNAQLFRTLLPQRHEESANLWSCIAMKLVLLSDDAIALLAFLRGLLKAARLYGEEPARIMDLVYFVALVALTGQRKLKISPRLHYSLFYASYLLENEQSASNNSTAENWTNEQEQIFAYKLKQHDVVRINAFAGSGKTSTLREYCRRHPNVRFLLIVFNKAASVVAERTFPPNAECHTMHSLAYDQVGRQYARPYGTFPKIRNLSVMNIVDAIDCRRKGLNFYTRAGFVKKTLEAFIASADAEVGLRHAPLTKFDPKTLRNEPVDELMRREFVEDASHIWHKRMKNPKDMSVGMSHDGYLKQFLLEHKTLVGKRGEHDVLFIDEAQDLTPAMLAILNEQKGPKVFVGDRNQQIYSFRHAVNALESVASTKNFHLTKSFRFGPEIAFTANCCLETLKDERKKTLVGTENRSQLNIRDSPAGLAAAGQQLTIICRENFTVFAECVSLAALPNIKLNVLGADWHKDNKKKDSELDYLKQLYSLSLPKERRTIQITNAFLQKWSSLHELRMHCEMIDDKETCGKIKIVERYRDTLLQQIENIQSCFVSNVQDADFLVTTAHKVKGLEFQNVRIATDFLEPIDPQTGALVPADADEKNLLYVAITRARERLLMNPSIYVLLMRKCQESFECMIPAGSIASLDTGLAVKALDVVDRQSTPVELKCVNCRQSFVASESELVLHRRPLGLASGCAKWLHLEYGPVCFACATARGKLGYRFYEDPNHDADARPLFAVSSGGIFAVQPAAFTNDNTRLSLRPFLMGAEDWQPLSK